MPTVSIVIPSYNYAAHVGEAIESALAQTWADSELIVVDDGSQDDSLAVIEGLAAKDGRVRVFSHPDRRNHGLAATLRLGLEKARGEWVAILEADDAWQPECLERRLEAARETGAEIVFNDVAPCLMEGMGAEWFESYVPRVMAAHAKRVKRAGGAYGPFFMRGAFLIENQLPTFSCAMIRRKALAACDFTSPVPAWLDRWVWHQAAQRATFAFVPEKLTIWRLHPGSYMGRDHAPTRRGEAAAYLRRAACFWQGLRGQLPAGASVLSTPWPLLVLHLPVAAPLFARAALMVQAHGARAVARRLWQKIGPRPSGKAAARKKTPGTRAMA